MLPKQCDICLDKIGLYQPYYTVQTKGHLTGDGWHKQIGVFCPRCFHAYKDFLTERKVTENHKRIMTDMIKAGKIGQI